MILRSVEQGYQRKRPPTPDQLAFLDSKPELDAGCTIMAAAYTELSTCRTLSATGIGPIPITAIWEWADRHGFGDDVELAQHFSNVIREVDARALQAARDRLASK